MNWNSTRKAWCLAAVAGAALAGGCVSLTDEGVGGPENVPVVGVTSRSLGFTVQGRGFNFEQHYASPTVGDSLAVGLTVVGYAGGTALIEVADSTGTLQLQQTVSQSIVQGTATVHGTPPYVVHLVFTNFSGTFSLGIGAQP